MSYKEDILARNPIGYWKLEGPISANLGTRGYSNAVWTSTNSWPFTASGVDGVDSMAFIDNNTQINFGHLNLNPSQCVTSFSMEFWFNFNYLSAKNRRNTLIWKDFDLNADRTGENGFGFAVYATPMESRVFLEVYLMDDTNTPAFYTYIHRKSDWEWYQMTTTSQLVDSGDYYLHKLYLDNQLISYTKLPVNFALPQFGDTSIYWNHSTKDAGSPTDADDAYGFVDEVSVYDYALSEETVTGTDRPDPPKTFDFTPTPPALLDIFVVDGIHHDFLPDAFVNVGDDFAVKVASYPTLDLRRVVVSQGNPREIAGERNKRKAYRQAWQASWSNPDDGAFMDQWMRDQLFNLYTLQRNVWIQYDDEMGRVSAHLHNVGSNYSVYYTPTFPIVPFGYDPSRNPNRDYNNHVFINGVLAADLAGAPDFVVDEETGAIVFASPLLSTDVVTMNYAWRVRVRVADFQIEPMADAPDAYIGTIMFEQVDFALEDDPWLITLPRELAREYGSGPTDNTCSIVSVESGTSSASDPTIPSTWSSEGEGTVGTTQGSNTSEGTVGSDGSVPSVGNTGTSINTFREYDTIDGRPGGTIIEVDWLIGRASEMSHKGCEPVNRVDEGIKPQFAQVYNYTTTPNNGVYFDFETDFMHFYIANNLPDIPATAEITGIEFHIEYSTRDFRIDDSRFPGVDTSVMTVQDTFVVPIVDGQALFDASHNKAENINLSKVLATPNGPYYENYGKRTVVYGGLGQLWGRTWTSDEIKGLWGVAVKAHVLAHSAYFTPITQNSLTDRAKPKIWCSQYRVYYKA